jgi:hypothetical protein
MFSCTSAALLALGKEVTFTKTQEILLFGNDHYCQITTPGQRE